MPSGGESTPSGNPSSEAVTVDSCEPENVPEFTGESDAFVVVENLNFRSGPGSDCSLVREDVLISGLEVRVTSDPVVREGDDSEWVRIEVDGQEGWVATEFIEPDDQ
jgi:SH3-like domain-containing protein